MVAVFEDAEVDHSADEGRVDADVVLMEDDGEGLVGGATVEVVKNAGQGFRHGERIVGAIGDDAVLACVDAGDVELAEAETFGNSGGHEMRVGIAQQVGEDAHARTADAPHLLPVEGVDHAGAGAVEVGLAAVPVSPDAVVLRVVELAAEFRDVRKDRGVGVDELSKIGFEFSCAPQDELLFGKHQELAGESPELVARVTTHMFAEPGRADARTVRPDAAFPGGAEEMTAKFRGASEGAGHVAIQDAEDATGAGPEGTDANLFRDALLEFAASGSESRVVVGEDAAGQEVGELRLISTAFGGRVKVAAPGIGALVRKHGAMVASGLGLGGDGAAGDDAQPRCVERRKGSFSDHA